MLLTGKEVSAEIIKDIKDKLNSTKSDRKPVISCIRLGDNADDIIYENSIIKKSELAGIRIDSINLARNPEREELLELIDRLNCDELVDGIMIFRPFDDIELEREVSSRIIPSKDIEAVSYEEKASSCGENTTLCGENSALCKENAASVEFYPCTAQAVMEMFDHYKIRLEGAKVAVIGRSPVIGKPVAKLLRQRGALVTVCHSKTLDLRRECLAADIIVCAVGKAGLITADMVKKEHVIIDVGVNQTEDGKMVGDTCFEEIKDKVLAITPVPGGVGSITSAILLKHAAYSFLKHEEGKNH